MYKALFCSFFLLSSIFALEVYEVGRDWKISALDDSFRGVVAFADEVEEYDRDDAYTYLYTIKDNHLTVTPPEKHISTLIYMRNGVISEAINKILKEKRLPDMSLLINLSDSFVREDVSDTVPVFTFSKKRNEHAVILMPDFELLSDNQPLIDSVTIGCIKYQWSTKVDQAFWRGSTTGGDFSQPNWREYPRSQLVLTTRGAHKSVNAHFTNYCQGAENNNEFLQEIGRCYPNIEIESHLIFKYLIDIDGNASTYPRFFWILLSNSAPFKVNSEFTQWYYRGLEPYTHYVPVNSDCSDLISKVEWARENDEMVEDIAKASREFALEHLTRDSAQDYLYLLLKRYGKIFI